MQTPKQFDKIFNPIFKAVKQDDANMKEIFASVVPTPSTYGQSGLKVYYGYDEGKGVRKYSANAAGVYEFSGKPISDAVLKTIYR